MNPVLFNTRNGPVRADSLPYILMHFMPIWAFFIDFHWSLILVALGSYYVRMFFITGFMHRYFSHKSFRVPSRIVQFMMALATATCAQKGVLWWASHHRHHHKYSDTEKDLHSPTQSGFWHSHTMWILTLESNKNYEQSELKDLGAFPELRWIDKWWIVGPILYGIALTAVGGIPWLVWGLFVSQVLLWHGTYTINSLSHVFGKPRFPTTDTSKNNWLLALVTLGEGWHNNHHYYQSSARNGFYWYELDIVYYGLWLMSKVGLIADLKPVPERVLAFGRLCDADLKAARALVKKRVLRMLTVQETRGLIAAAEKAVDRTIFSKLSLEELRNLIRTVGIPAIQTQAVPA